MSTHPLRGRLASEAFTVGTWSEPSEGTQAIDIEDALPVIAAWLREEAGKHRTVAIEVGDPNGLRSARPVVDVARWIEDLADSISPEEQP